MKCIEKHRHGYLYWSEHASRRCQERLGMTPEELVSEISDIALRMAFYGATSLKNNSKGYKMILNGSGCVITIYKNDSKPLKKRSKNTK